MRGPILTSLLVLSLAAAGCESTAPAPAPAPAPAVPSPHVLPRGDAVAGRVAFLMLDCHVCHRVKGGGFPEPTIHPPLSFVLGEGWTAPLDELWLTTSLVNPSHEVLEGHRVTFHGSGEVYRMREYGDSMTVGQMVDLVAYLKTLAD